MRAAEADANVVPRSYELPLRLELEPLIERDPEVIGRDYGETMGQRIIDHLQIEDATRGPSVSLTGKVTSESGDFHERLDVAAYRREVTSPSRFLRGEPIRASVVWTQAASGS